MYFILISLSFQDRWKAYSTTIVNHMEEKLGDTKGVVRSHKSKDRQYNGQNKRTKEQTMINKTLHRKHTKDWATEIPLKMEWTHITPEGLAVPAPLMAPIKHYSNKLHMKMYTSEQDITQIHITTIY